MMKQKHIYRSILENANAVRAKCYLLSQNWVYSPRSEHLKE